MKDTRNPKSGCFSTVLRRLLCSGGPQTHPSDQISDLYRPDFGYDEKTDMFAAAEVSAAPPGIVARLMGLDSFPEKVSVSEDPARVSRSKSVNFIDYLLELDTTTEARHRRFRTSVSFREVPSKKQLQEKHHGQELLLIYLENGAGKQSKTEQRKCKEEKVIPKKEERKNNKISKLKDEPRRGRRGRISEGKMEKRSKSKEIVGGRREREQTPAADDRDLRQHISSSKTQWSGKLGISCESSFDSVKSVKSETDSLVESLGNLRKLTEEDVKSEDWRREMSEVNGEELEEICEGLEGLILQVMLDQVADELLGIW